MSSLFLLKTDAANGMPGLHGVNGFLLSMVVLHLLETRRLNKHMSSYQIFRVTMEMLATSGWASTGVIMTGAADKGTVGRLF